VVVLVSDWYFMVEKRKEKEEGGKEKVDGK
jgi:hypothetical protein